MTDDAGFAVPSTFGGVIPTPTIDRIADDGLRYNRMFSTALCSPTRAAMITGRNHHSVGFGVIAEQATGFPGYDSVIAEGQGDDRPDPARQRLRHVLVRQGPQHADLRGEPGRAVHQWPTGMGFDYFYGFVGGDANQWGPNLFRNTTQIYPSSRGHPKDGSLRPEGRDLAGHREESSWNLITAMADDAIDWMTRIHQTDPQPADLHQLRARRLARAAPPDQGMGGQDPRDAPLRRRLREAARAHLRRTSRSWA